MLCAYAPCDNAEHHAIWLPWRIPQVTYGCREDSHSALRPVRRPERFGVVAPGMRWLILLAPLCIQLVLLYALSSTVNRVAFQRLGKTLYLLVMWPGVIVHELSHLVGCLLTRTRVREVHLFSPREEGPGNLVLGFVTHDKPSNPVATFVVSAAPFFGGAAALALILRLTAPQALTGIVIPTAAFADPAAVAADTLRAYAGFLTTLGRSLDWGSWTSWLAAFLLFSVSAHVAPSRHDMKYALAGAAGIAALVAAFAWAGGRYAPGIVAGAATWTAKAVAVTGVLLGYGLACVATAALLLLVFGSLADAVRGRR